MERDRIGEYLDALGVDDVSTKSELLERYTDEIMLFNPTLKLVGSKERDEVIMRHIFDSASAYPVFLEETEDGDRIADMGSGAGLPGVVLAILFPSRKFYLIERMQRRAGFLRSVTAVLRLDNAVVIDADIKNIRERFDAVTARAFHPVLDIASDAVKLSSKALFYKGTMMNTSGEVSALRSAGYTFSEKIIPLEVPGMNEERNILVLENWGKK